MAEQGTHKPLVDGSNPSLATNGLMAIRPPVKAVAVACPGRWVEAILLPSGGLLLPTVLM